MATMKAVAILFLGLLSSKAAADLPPTTCGPVSVVPLPGSGLGPGVRQPLLFPFSPHRMQQHAFYVDSTTVPAVTIKRVQPCSE